MGFCTHFLVNRHTYPRPGEGFPGGLVVRNPPANSGDAGSIPGPGRSHMPLCSEAHEPQPWSLCSRAREPQLLKPACLQPVPRNERGDCNGKTRPPQQRVAPLTATRESLRAATKTQHSHQ